MTRTRSILKTPIGSTAVKYYKEYQINIKQSPEELVHYKGNITRQNKTYGAADAEALAEALAEAILIKVLARRSASFPERSA